MTFEYNYKRKEVKTMARKPMVSRTVKSTTVTCLCVDTVLEQTVEKTVTVPRVHKEDKLLKVVKEYLDNDELKVVSIKSFEVSELLYGMTEKEFIENAKILDKETRKPIEN